MSIDFQSYLIGTGVTILSIAVGQAISNNQVDLAISDPVVKTALESGAVTKDKLKEHAISSSKDFASASLQKYKTLCEDNAELLKESDIDCNKILQSFNPTTP